MIKETVDYIVEEAPKLVKKNLGNTKISIDWVAIFTQDEKEYRVFLEEALSIGEIIKKNRTGPIFKLNQPFITKFGNLYIIKIRKPDKTRPQRGDADFRITKYKELKNKYLKNKHFLLIKREDFEMIELRDDSFDVLVYFSNPPISKVLGLS